MVAGEASGDLLGAGLIQALKKALPTVDCEGIAGPQMIAAGCRALYQADRLAVMGLVEVLGRYRELLGIRRDLVQHFLAERPAVFVGIDAPDFNLGLEAQLKRRGIRTVHYVSPSVWAWRQYRVRTIARSADLMLTLFPFEADFYRDHGMPVRFVGHPLADMIPLEVDCAAARRELGLAEEGELVAVLPGSRMGELNQLAEPFVQTAAWLHARRPGLRFVAPLVNAETHAVFAQAIQKHAPQLPITLVDSRSREVMAAANVVLLASGTATLEALLLKRPMVVAYRLAGLTFRVVKALFRAPYFSLPNMLAGRRAVEEYVQDEVMPDVLGPAVLRFLESPERASALQDEFGAIHHALRQNASERAAEAILELVR